MNDIANIHSDASAWGPAEVEIVKRWAEEAPTGIGNAVLAMLEVIDDEARALNGEIERLGGAISAVEETLSVGADDETDDAEQWLTWHAELHRLAYVAKFTTKTARAEAIALHQKQKPAAPRFEALTILATRLQRVVSQATTDVDRVREAFNVIACT